MTYPALAEMFFFLLVWHVIADYPLQGDFLAKAKNPANPILGVPWALAMGSHSLIHAGGVTVITGSLVLGIAEFICHFQIDYAKCRGWLSFGQDQFLHFLCKIMWVYPAYYHMA